MQKGFIALSSILLISFIAVSLSVVVTLLSVGASQSALAQTNGEQTLFFVHGCAEDALIKAWGDINYTGSNITRPEGTCTVSVSKVGTVWTMTISTTDTNYTKTARITFNRGSTITVTSWTD